MLRFSIFYLAVLSAIVFSACSQPAAQPTETQTTSRPDYALVIHGGAGVMKRGGMSAEREAAYKAALQAALNTGEAILKEGGTSLDAIEAVIRVMEDDSLFNSGRGAVLTHKGKAELDASIMDGSDKNAGAVAGVQRVKHPITAARKVMEASKHVMLSGKGAETFADQQGLTMIENDYFITARRKAALERIIARELETQEKGTVGAVALDKAGNLAAGTSTGGMMNKRYGRIGDSPVIGAGTYADNQTCAVSCTGHGEFFIRYAVAYDVSAMMAYGGKSVVEASDEIINQKLKDIGGSGGLIAVDHQGNVAMPFNSSGMFRGFVKSDGTSFVGIYTDEE